MSGKILNLVTQFIINVFPLSATMHANIQAFCLNAPNEIVKCAIVNFVLYPEGPGGGGGQLHVFMVHDVLYDKLGNM